ncbi:cellulose binding domain-containing protein [Micromonospora sp. WMMD967]|uniref:cellulose binding domain-containing protein n=1 Tax=Micromonospora sp. WMMD967 TaxID=3016101 RepID=UPI0024159907|nr:cellulose binding domain-containing protein [Micromonospora sp. WMMD967]MDG4839975.1 cellulose binding domain-containing protein [Micromonospora sp. WMMD967]
MLRMFLAATTAALAVLGGATATGAAGATGPTPLTTQSPGPTPTVACPPALPITARVAGVTTTSVTISYSIFFRPPCGYDPPMTVSLFANREDAEMWREPVASAVSGTAEQNSTVTVDRLTPDTEYWYRFTDAEGRRDPYMIGSARTAPVASCRATAMFDARWGSGFVATVTVRNTGSERLDGWRVSWRWSGDERVQSVWGGVAETVGVDVTVRNAAYNGTLAVDGVATFGLVATTSSVPDGLTLSCAG